MRSLFRFVLLIGVSASACAQWQVLDAHTTADFRGVHYVGNGVAWVSGTNGTVLRTEDMGKTWTHCAVPPGAETLDFRGVQAFDAKTAIVMSSGPGDQSRLYKTTDGCGTWKLVFTNPDRDGFWDALKMSFNATYINGVLIGDPVGGSFPIFVTTDNGNSWRRKGEARPGWTSGCKERDAHARANEGLFAASNSSLVFWSGPNLEVVFVTGGKPGARFVFSDESDWDGSLCSVRFGSWRLPFANSSADSIGAFAVAAAGDGPKQKLLVVGGDYKFPDLPSASFLIEQQFANFHLPGMLDIYRRSPSRSTAGPHGYRSAVAYEAKAQAWIAVGPNGTDTSTDDGRSWRALHPGGNDSPDADRDWNALSLPFVVGPHGRIGLLRGSALVGVSSAKGDARTRGTRR